ncbi:OmpA family protein [Microbacterium gorillae]|uniref:OmpA family protein n=1 Tax=Microbacterium gorillae TaxID=1231063 RepID=UPI000693FAC4|nr:OmpA family protein [Microbacterium gorillae]
MSQITHRALVATALTLASVGVLAGCAGGPAATAPATTAAAAQPAAAPAENADADPDVATVAGYAPGQFPPVPLFTLPDISLLDASLAGFAIDLTADLTPRPGLDIRPAACGDMTERAAGRGTALLYGDGSGNYTGPDGSTQNYGDGSGTFTANGVTSTVYGDGSGSYESDQLTIQNYGDGSGSATTPTGETWVYGDGSGSYKASGVEQWNYGDGSAEYIDSTVEIHNYGDGSGSYVTADLDIHNYGDGTARVNGTDIAADPIAPEAPIGTFPPMGVIAPITSCGTTITLQDGVLFDFDKSDIRPDASATLDELAAALKELNVPAAEIGGHTDAIGDDAYNQDLSERRAQSVVDALVSRGVTGTLTVEGYGESAPVAANEVDGHDNPAGRQLNRRVEIFIPAF